MLWAKKEINTDNHLLPLCTRCKYEWQTVKNHISHMYSVCAAGEDSGGE